jgi:hypothetical protein
VPICAAILQSCTKTKLHIIPQPICMQLIKYYSTHSIFRQRFLNSAPGLYGRNVREIEYCRCEMQIINHLLGDGIDAREEA